MNFCGLTPSRRYGRRRGQRKALAAKRLLCEEACRVSLQWLMPHTRQRLAARLPAYRAAVNFYFHSLWHQPGKLDRNSLARLRAIRRSERYQSQALKQALERVIATKRSTKALGGRATGPRVRGAATLDDQGATLEPGYGRVDLAMRLSTLVKGYRMILPTRRTTVLNQWLNQPRAK